MSTWHLPDRFLRLQAEACEDEGEYEQDGFHNYKLIILILP